MIRYEVEQLLHLRESPLVAKPAGLPPAEEWMGPPVEQPQRKLPLTKGRNEGSFSDNHGTRSTLLESRTLGRSSNNDPSSIVLGPPKTSFTSSGAAKSPGRPFESPGRSAFGSFGGDASKGDYFGRARFSGGDGKDERSRDGLSARGGRGDTNGPRSARTFGEKDDRFSRRSGDASIERGEGRRQQRGSDAYNVGEDGRRNGTRSGSKPSWYQDGDISEPHIRGEADRSKDWRDTSRRNHHGYDRDGGRDGRVEQDPEWLMDGNPDERKEKHTAQDIEQWKASMKARELGEQENARAGLPNSQNQSRSGGAGSKGKLGAPLTLQNGPDSFFNMWGDSKPGKGLQTSDEGFKSESARLAPKSSRFTDFFSPQPVLTPSTMEPPASSTQPSQSPPQDNGASNDDKVGFQRMIQQLRSQKPVKLSSPPMGNAESAKQDRSTPPQEANDMNSSQSPPIISPRSRKSHQLENILGLQSPLEAPATMNRDSEFLLNLIRSDPGLAHVLPLEHQKLAAGGAPGMPPHPNFMNHHMQGPHGIPDEGGMRPPFFDDHPPEPAGHFDKLNPNASGPMAQRPRPPFDRPEDGGPGNSGGFNPPHPHMGMPPPPGLGRPMQPPGPFSPFGGPHPPLHPQQQPPRMVGPPPGFPSQPPSGKQQSFPPGLPPLGSLSLGGERAPYGMPAMGGGPPPGGDAGGPPFAPGPLQPPPGNGMHPSFPPHGGFPPMGSAGGGPGHFGPPGGRPPGPPGGPGPMDMFGEYGNPMGRPGGGLIGRRPD